MVASSPDKAIENSTKIAQAIIVAISRGRKGITEEEYETGINFLKKIYENMHSRAQSPLIIIFTEILSFVVLQTINLF